MGRILSYPATAIVVAGFICNRSVLSTQMSDTTTFEFFGKYAQVILKSDCWGALLIISPKKLGRYRVKAQLIDGSKPLIDTVITAEHPDANCVVRFPVRLESKQFARIWINFRPLQPIQK